MRELTLNDFQYDLPSNLIAQQPLKQRDQSRLCFRDRQGKVEHRKFSQLPDCLPPQSLIVVNDTRVIPCRLLTKLSTGGKVEFFLLSQKSKNPNVWTAMGKPMKKIRHLKEIRFDQTCSATLDFRDDNEIELTFNLGDSEFFDWINSAGYVPLPPYIKRPDPQNQLSSEDRQTYQTVYAKQPGSVAAPTAGLHFTPELRNRLEERGMTFCSITLHVGLGTFKPVTSDDPHQHHMHSENYVVSGETHRLIEEARTAGRPIIAVGTTSLRCLESFYAKPDPGGSVDKWQSTNLFIWPKTDATVYKPKTANGIITNFHQPGSTLFMLICALLGYKNATSLYRDCVEREYRFFSYGDSCLFLL
ncbi:MAG: tRNA preQ1(34) S-adenosylmethionine ribosyltransferase-isomerase QueA [Oligoflexales bacterium]